MLPQFINMLSWWQWAILAVVPPAIILLYFLKLKRRPLEVPSTYLWHKSIEDLHVNSIWQRLRRNLLLFLQLLLLLFLAFSLLRPGWRGERLVGDRFVLLIDNSASMQATDVDPSRLDEAKRQAKEVVEQMQSGDEAMIVSFSNTARVEQMFTSDRRQLARAIDGIEPTARSTDILEALKLAAAQANPGRTGEASDAVVAEVMPAELYIFSDGRFNEVQGFSLGALEPVYRKIGAAEPSNVGIVAFSVGQNEVRPDQLQAFARLENSGPNDATIAVKLFLNDTLNNADELTIPAGQSRGVAFPLSQIDSGVLRLELGSRDDLTVDDAAWAPVNPPRRAKVLLVSDGNPVLENALSSEPALELAEVTIVAPDYLKTPEYARKTSAREFDLVIFDTCAPEEMPQANTLFFAALPPAHKPPEKPVEGESEDAAAPAASDAAKKPGADDRIAWKAAAKQPQPAIIDIDIAHPVMRWMNLSDVRLAEGTPLEPPRGATVLIDSDVGPMAAIAPREGFEDLVVGFAAAIYKTRNTETKTEGVIGWPIRASFPAFLLNVLDYLGRRHTATAGGSVPPGEAVELAVPTTGQEVTVRTPSGGTVRPTQVKTGKFSFTGTEQLGIYEVMSAGQTVSRFAVNLLKPSESDVRPRQEIQLGWVKVEGQAVHETIRRELWKLLLLVGLAILLLEWYIYNRRIYL